MARPARPRLEAGRVYRTQDFASWSTNPPRLAKRLVQEGKLVPLAHGLYSHPKQGRFGRVPPSDEKLMRAFLKGGPFVFTGPDRWNALGLGSTAVFSVPLVYNTKRSGTFLLGGRKFQLRRVAFPRSLTPEWFVVDLFEHAEQAGVSRSDLTNALRVALREGRFNDVRLWKMASRYGSRDTQARVRAALASQEHTP